MIFASAGPSPFTPISYFAGNLSDDGSALLMQTSAQLLPADADGTNDMYVWDAGTLRLIGDTPTASKLSADGEFIAFTTSLSLAGNDGDANADVYRVPVTGGAPTLISTGTAANSTLDAIAADGQLVVFSTTADPTGSGDVDTGSALDVFAGSGGTPIHMSAAQNAAEEELAATFVKASRDATKVLVTTPDSHTNSDSDAGDDLFVHDTVGNITMVSSVGTADAPTHVASSDDLSVVYWHTAEVVDAGNDLDGTSDVYRHPGSTLVTGTAALTGASSVTEGMSSANGSRFFFTSGDELAAADDNLVFDLYASTNGGAPALLSNGGATDANGVEALHAVTPDGAHAVYSTFDDYAGYPAMADGNKEDVMRWDGITTALLTPNTADHVSIVGGVSDDGSRLFAETNENLLPALDGDPGSDVYEFVNGTADILSEGDPGGPVGVFAEASTDGSVVLMHMGKAIDPADTDGTQLDTYLARIPAPATTTTTDPGGSTSAPADTTPPPSGGTAATSQAVPPPVEGRSFNAQPVSGTVRVRVAGSSQFVPLAALASIPSGSIVDATNGKVRLYTTDGKGGIQFADFSAGLFKITQLKGGLVELTLVGGSFAKCPKPKKASAAMGKSVRKLWGEGKGKFRTKGRFAAATLRGTKWLTDDRCDGTLVKVTQGSVTVRDLVKRLNRVLKAPKQYFAAQRKPRGARKR